MWHFLSSHGIVLLVIATDTAIRLQDLAERVGITERAVQRIVADLISAGYLTRKRVGRRNVYEVHSEVTMRHPTSRHVQVGQLLDALTSGGEAETT